MLGNCFSFGKGREMGFVAVVRMEMEWVWYAWFLLLLVFIYLYTLIFILRKIIKGILNINE